MEKKVKIDFDKTFKNYSSKEGISFREEYLNKFLEKGVTCICVVPVFIADFDSQKGKEKNLKGHWIRHPQTPNLVLKRFGNPDEVAEVIANLCKKDADYINGQTLHVNGGSYTP